MTTIVFLLTKDGQDRFIKTQHDTANDLPENVVALLHGYGLQYVTRFQ